MTTCVMYLESQKAKMIGFSEFSELASTEVDIEKIDENTYYSNLADSLEATSEVLILGPDNEKGAFRRWILKNRRALGRKVVAVLPAKSISKEIAKTYRNKYLR